MARLDQANVAGNKFDSRSRILARPHAYLDGAECMFCHWRQPSLPSFLRRQLKPCRDKRGQLWGWRLILSAPRRSTILKLDALVRRQHGKVSRFDVALDWLVTDAAQWQNRFVRHLVLRWRCKGRPMHDIGATTYWCRPGAKRNLVIYADKPSKLDGRPCCHLELRIQTVKNALAEGVTHLSDLLTLNPQRLFAKHVKWSHCGEEKLEQIRQQAAQQARRQLIKGGPFYPVHERYYRNLPGAAQHLLKVIGQDRAQTVKKEGHREAPTNWSKTIPTQLMWKEERRRNTEGQRL